MPYSQDDTITVGSLDRIERTLIRKGLEPEEAKLLARAIRLSRSRDARVSMDVSPLRSVQKTMTSLRGKSYRKHHKLIIDAITKISDSEAAFGDVPDPLREQHSAFCYEMYKGNQVRFLDRQPDESPEEFIDKPRKSTLNITSLVINTISKLYHEAPVRKLDPDTPQSVSDALGLIWNDLYNLTMLEADRYVRLLGTVAIRPFYDESVPGGIRPWIFLSHQLRVIPDEDSPWKAAAVIERAQPFATSPKSSIWTAKSYVTIKDNQITYEPHDLGRIPHTFFKDRLSFTSFFVEGRGRVLCDPNAVLNNCLSDLEEIKQLQGFAVTQIVNPAEDDIRIGPRQAFVFRPQGPEDQFGVKFVTPDAPIAVLRADINEIIKDILRINRVPTAALGVDMNRRQISGKAIQAAMQPIIDDMKERSRLFSPQELDFADSCLRILSAHKPGFSYNPATEKPYFQIEYAPLEFPISGQDQVVQDDFAIRQGIKTPADIIRRMNPDRFKTYEQAYEHWKKNISEIKGLSTGEEGPGSDILGMLQGETDYDNPDPEEVEGQQED